jgi:ribosome-associated protein
VKEVCLELPYRHEGMTAAQWVLVDYINIVVHIFQPETRKFYRLEEMWSDADLQEHL